jgi:8-oxo-dGTP diphosphatase
MDREIGDLYGNRVRVRACGLCWQNGKLLVVNHHGLTRGDFWAPPGGGVEFEESVEQCLQREFREETGLQISCGAFLFACEYVQRPLHAIELWFNVAIDGGVLQRGEDPERAMIKDVQFMTASELTSIPQEHLHGIFSLVRSPEALQTLTGFFRI